LAAVVAIAALAQAQSANQKAGDREKLIGAWHLAHIDAPGSDAKSGSAAQPKGMLIYFAILPQFMHHDGSIALQAVVLSAIFIGLCGFVYAILSFVLATGSRGSISDRRRRWVEGISGGMLAVAATRLASG